MKSANKGKHIDIKKDGDYSKAKIADKRLFTRYEAAIYLGTTAANLAVAACRKTLPIPVVKLGRACRYDIHDLDKFINDQKTQI